MLTVKIISTSHFYAVALGDLADRGARLLNNCSVYFFFTVKFRQRSSPRITGPLTDFDVLMFRWSFHFDVELLI
jgi:hypothetical protein